MRQVAHPQGVTAVILCRVLLHNPAWGPCAQRSSPHSPPSPGTLPPPSRPIPRAAGHARFLPCSVSFSSSVFASFAKPRRARGHVPPSFWMTFLTAAFTIALPPPFYVLRPRYRLRNEQRPRPHRPLFQWSRTWHGRLRLPQRRPWHPARCE